MDSWMDARPIHEELFLSCRSGDLDRVKYLVEYAELELNVRDKWDSTPLYYACLCGHDDVVEYLLKNGARCEANTFDGERCLYAALSQKIKQILKDYKAITVECMRRDSYREFLRGYAGVPYFDDICFLVHGESIFAHKIIISSRCPYLAEMLETRWKGRRVVSLKHHLIKPTAFKSFIQYLYTGRLDVPLNSVNDLSRLCKQCKMNDVISKLEDAVRNFHFYADTKPSWMRSRVSVISVEPDLQSTELQDEFSQVAEVTIPHPFRDYQFPSSLPDIFYMQLPELQYSQLPPGVRFVNEDGLPLYADICFIVEGYKFYCHKVFFCGRSDYFKAFGHFSETVNSSGHDAILDVTLNDISAEAFSVIVAFIYTDQCRIPDELLTDLLYFSDLFLLPGLKRQCAARLSQLLTTENVVLTLRLARLHELNRLEARCCEFMAERLDEIVHLEEFAEIVKEDAISIRERQETDSIPIVDDIRYHLLNSALPGLNIGEATFNAETNLLLLEGLLQKLGVEG